jgi:HK97 family phage major capsid protein
MLFGERSQEQRNMAFAAGYGNKQAFVLKLNDTFAQSVGNVETGGYAAQPNLIQGFEEARKVFGGARNFGRVIRTDNGNPLPWVLSNQTAGAGALVGESAAVANVTLTISKTELNAFKFTSNAVPVSIEALQDVSGFEGWIGRVLGERIGRAEATYFTTGSGNTSQPQGLVTGANVASSATANTLSYDTMVNIEHDVDPAYRTNAAWSFNDLTLRQLKKLRDENDELIWVPGLAGTAPDTILGYSYIINQGIANLAAANTNTTPIVFGSRDHFLVRDVKDVVILKLEEISALNGEVVFVAFSRSDSMVLDAGTHPIVKWKHDRTGE